MYTHLFQEDRIGNLILRNRFVMAPMGNNFGESDQVISERQIKYYERRAQGGVGLILTESAPVCEQGVHGKNRIQVYRENAVPELRKLTDAVHKYDCKIVLQITHGGCKCSPEVIGEYPVAPSSLSIPRKDFIPRSLSIPEIEFIIQQYVKATQVAKAANFDGVEILAASGHLIHSFLSPFANKRTDKYGGSLENRLRFIIEIVNAIQETTQSNFPILVKMVGKDPENAEGTRIPEEDAVALAIALVKSGVASLHLSTNFSYRLVQDRNNLINLVKRIKQLAKVKIAIAGDIFHPLIGEKILQEGTIDFIEIGRPLLADPDYVNKAASDKEIGIRPCLNCNLCRYETSRKNPIRCTVNPLLGKENHQLLNKKFQMKHVTIIGGGPAGIQAAIQLDAMGYQGILYEKDSRLGGMLQSASIAPGRGRIAKLTENLIYQFNQTHFQAVLNTDMSANSIDLEKLEHTDAIIVATGALPHRPKQFENNENIFLASDILSNKTELNGNITILGGGRLGCEAADFISNNCKVTIMCASPDVCKNVIKYERVPLLKRLGEKGIRILVNSVIKAFDGTTVSYTHNNIEEIMECNTLIIAKGWDRNNNLQQFIESKFGRKVFLIGDASLPRGVLEALEDGIKVAELIAERTNNDGQ
jgi:2,4-dienoyl-CoA reductase-like NADH-dependent reductase (Old Yellow Enzyme family)/thioredoxin reductase